MVGKFLRVIRRTRKEIRQGEMVPRPLWYWCEAYYDWERDCVIAAPFWYGYAWRLYRWICRQLIRRVFYRMDANPDIAAAKQVGFKQGLEAQITNVDRSRLSHLRGEIARLRREVREREKWLESLEPGSDRYVTWMAACIVAAAGGEVRISKATQLKEHKLEQYVDQITDEVVFRATFVEPPAPVGQGPE